MHGSAAIDRAQLPGSFVSHTATDAVAKKTEWHAHQRFECMIEPLHQRAHRGQWCLVKAPGTARQLDGTQIDVGMHKAPKGPVKRGISCGMRKAEKAAANDRAFISKWYPPVERHSVRSYSTNSLIRNGAGPKDRTQERLRLKAAHPRPQVAAAGNARYSFLRVKEWRGLRADIQGNCNRKG
jgi:hypothetical protein